MGIKIRKINTNDKVKNLNEYRSKRDIKTTKNPNNLKGRINTENFLNNSLLGSSNTKVQFSSLKFQTVKYRYINFINLQTW